MILSNPYPMANVKGKIYIDVNAQNRTFELRIKLSFHFLPS